MGKRREGTTGITAPNKDVVSKWFSETMKTRSLTVYGIDVPKIVDVRPTNLPAIETNEHRMDNLFLLYSSLLINHLLCRCVHRQL